MNDSNPIFSMSMIFWLSQSIVFLIVAVPTFRFIYYGWELRRQEFVNRFGASATDAYLLKFWPNHYTNDTKKSNASSKFIVVYNRISGRKNYILPILLLVISLILIQSFVIQYAIRFGYEQYIQSYMGYKNAETGVFREAVWHLPLTTLNATFYPFPPLIMNKAAMTAEAGAYLAVVQIVIYGYKTRTLLSSDLLWASFRIAIAIPLGIAVGGIVAGPLGGLISFGLGALPIDAIIKLLRRITARSVNQAEARDSDDLLMMNGVTPDVSARLKDEGIYAPQQLVATDPVSLAIRTGLSFDFVLGLVAQAQLWSYFGSAVTKLTPIGCGDARMIYRFFRPGAVPPAGIRTAIAQALAIEETALTAVLVEIAGDSFTKFLYDLNELA